MRHFRTVAAVLILILLVSCDGSVNDRLFSEEKYTVMFDPGGEVSPFGITVTSGTVIDEPERPERQGYVFIEWREGDKAFDFSSRIMRDIWLSAAWERDVGQTRISVYTDDGPVEDGTPVILAGPMEFQGYTVGGVYSIENVPTGTYSVSAAGFSFGDIDVVLGQAAVLRCDIYTVSFSRTDGVISVPEGTSVTKGSAVSAVAEIEPGWHFTGWYEGDDLISASSDVEIPVLTGMHLEARAEKTVYPITFSGPWHDPGHTDPDTYVKEPEAQQWFVITAPLRHGYRAVSYGVTKPEGEGDAVYDGGFLKIDAGAYGPVILDPVWERYGGSVTVSVRRDGEIWPDSGHVLSLVSAETVLAPEEAEEVSGVWTWPEVSCGTYAVYSDGFPTAASVTVSDGEDAQAYADWWSVTAIAGEGIASVSGSAVVPSGGYAHLSAVAREGRLFDSWREGGALYSLSRNISVGPVTSTRSLLAVGFQEPEVDPVPLGGAVFHVSDGDNGAVYHFYGADMTEIPKPWTREDLADAAWYSVAGNPEFPKFWITAVTEAPGETYTWGTFGVASGARGQGLGAGEHNTALALTSSVDEGSLWESLPAGWFVGSRAENGILLGVFPDLYTPSLWSSEESDQYGAWIRMNGEWIVAGKNSLGTMLPMKTI